MYLYLIYTPLKTNMSPKKALFQKEIHLNQPLIFRGHISFPGSMYRLWTFYCHVRLLECIHCFLFCNKKPGHPPEYVVSCEIFLNPQISRIFWKNGICKGRRWLRVGWSQSSSPMVSYKFPNLPNKPQCFPSHVLPPLEPLPHPLGNL